MGKPKKQTSNRKKGLRRSHLVLKLARMVNGKSPVKVFTTRRETGAKKAAPNNKLVTDKRPSTKTQTKKTAA